MIKKDRGSAHDGMAVWWWQRISGFYIALIAIPFIMALKGIGPDNYSSIVAFFSSSAGKAVCLAFIASVMTHAYIGLRIILEDYVPAGWLRLPLVAILNLVIAIIGLWTAMVIVSFS